MGQVSWPKSSHKGIGVYTPTIADHLSRMQIEDIHDLPINDYLRDDTLLKVSAAYPWYANIVNYMVSGYVPLGWIRRS